MDPTDSTDAAWSKVRKVPIRTATIELAALLKYAQMAASGGEAKQRVQGGAVRVNGVVERHRARRLVPGDVVESGGTRVVVVRERDEERSE